MIYQRTQISSGLAESPRHSYNHVWEEMFSLQPCTVPRTSSDTYLIVVSRGLVWEELVVQVDSVRAQDAQQVLHLLSYHLQEVVDGVDTTLTNTDTLQAWDHNEL